jgi:predicted lipoprotein with Yx(FWY)xxD motif
VSPKSITALLMAVAVVLVVAACGSGTTPTKTTNAIKSEEEAKTAETRKTEETARKAEEGKRTQPTKTATTGLQISTKSISGHGEVLVNAGGRTLYIFLPDKDSKVTCVGSCAAVWPPVKLSRGESPAASGAVKSALLGSDPDPSGGTVITYNGWPLYAYVADASPGTVTGQAVNANGGLWYVIAPSGEVIKKKAP